MPEKDPDHIGELTKIVGHFRDGQPEPDADLRDTATVPLKESIKAYFKREVLPHVPDAWIDDTALTRPALRGSVQCARARQQGQQGDQFHPLPS